MVGASELPFRLLCRRHGAQLCYTPMMHAAEFIDPAHVASGYGVGALQTRPSDAPLVAHFAANDPAVLLAAARRAEPYAVAIDLNLGCPQRSAHSGHYGAFLTDPGPDRPLVLGMVSAVARGCKLPIFVKIRLQETLEGTLEFAHQLEAAGADLIAVHGRIRGHWAHRRKGPADLSQIKAVKEAVNVPVLTNGNVRGPEELLASLEQTGADGVMSAEGALDDPAIFARAAELHAARRRKVRRSEGGSNRAPAPQLPLTRRVRAPRRDSWRER
jgi:tRNA-dihydrouridine synthase 1